MPSRKVIAPMLVESGGEHPKNVTHSDVEAALMMSRIKTECSGQKIDGIVRTYFTLKAVPLEGGRYFLIDGIGGTINSFVLGLVDLKVPIVEKLAQGANDPDILREILKGASDEFLDYDNTEILKFRGLVDPIFKRGVQDWSVHATFDTLATSLFIPDVIRTEDPEVLLKSLKGLENAFESQITNCIETSASLKQTLDGIESRVMDSISSISLSPAMEDQKKKLLDRIKALGSERDQKISEAEDKVRSVKSTLDVGLREHLERLEELTQKLRGSETLVRQLEEEKEEALLKLRTEEARLEGIENQILESTRRLREVELKKVAVGGNSPAIENGDSDLRQSTSSTSSRRESGSDNSAAKLKTKKGSDDNSTTIGSSDPQDSTTTTTTNESSSSSGQTQVEELKVDVDGDILGEKMRQEDRSIEELSLEVANLSFMLPQVRSHVNALKSTLNAAEAKLKNAKEEMDIVKKTLEKAISQKVLATGQEASLLQAMKDDIAHISYEYQQRIESILKQVSLIEIGLKEQEYQFQTLRREITFRIHELTTRLEDLASRNRDTKKRLFDDSVIVFPSPEPVTLEIAFPAYIVFNREGKPRFKVLLPSYVSKLSSAEVREKLIAKNVKSSFIRRLLGSRAGNSLIGRLMRISGSSTLSFTEPEGFRSIAEKIASIIERDVGLSNWIMSTLPTTNLLTQNDFFDNVNSGLQKLQTDGTLSSAEVSELRNWALEIAAA